MIGWCSGIAMCCCVVWWQCAAVTCCACEVFCYCDVAPFRIVCSPVVHLWLRLFASGCISCSLVQPSPPYHEQSLTLCCLPSRCCSSDANDDAEEAYAVGIM